MQRDILVTGASGHLGRAVAAHFIAKGWKVVTIDRSPVDAGHPDNLHTYKCDLTNESQTRQTFAEIFREHAGIDAAVLLAGGFSMGDILNTGTEDIDKMIALNFKTAYHAARASIGHFMDRNGGDVIFIGAKPALEVEASAAMVAYALSKSMVVRLAETINAMQQRALRASVIAPSVIDTPANRDAMPDADYSAWVKPGDIARAIDFILSDEGGNLRHTVLKMYNAS
jgi:NAD(P)-dependent dehydrogenase (short-subunit alcohol dehydrogenase family)